MPDRIGCNPSRRGRLSFRHETKSRSRHAMNNIIYIVGVIVIVIAILSFLGLR